MIRLKYALMVVLGVTLLLGDGVFAADDSSLTKQPALIAGDRTLTLAECIALALQNQASIRLAQATVLSQTGSLSTVHAGILPLTRLSADTPLLGSNNNGHISILVSSNQLIYDFGHTPQAVHAERQLRAASLQNLSGAAEDVVLNVQQAYYTLLQDQHLVDVYRENLTDQQAHLDETQAQFAAGVIPHTNVLLAETSVAQARVAVVTGQNAAAQARLALALAMGIDIRSPIKIVDATEPAAPLPTEEDAMALALARRPEMQRDRDQLAAAQATLKSALAGYWPTINATAGFSPDAGTAGAAQQQALTLAIDLQWPIFDQGVLRGAVQQARAQIATATETLYNDQQIIENEVEQARLNIQAAEASLTYATTEVTSAQANLEAAEGSYKAGVGIFLTVIDAQAALLQAQENELAARYGLSMGRTMLEHAIGADVPYGKEIVAHANTLK